MKDTEEPLSTNKVQTLALLKQLQQPIPFRPQFFQSILSSFQFIIQTIQLGMSHFIHTFFQSAISPLDMFLLFILGPFIATFLLFIFLKLLLLLLRSIFPFLWKKLMDKPQIPVFLEVTIPTDTNKSAFATQQLYLLLHKIAKPKGLLTLIRKQKKSVSFEIVATKKEGIRYLLVVPKDSIEIIKRSLLSFLPGVTITETQDYLSDTQFPLNWNNHQNSHDTSMLKSISVEELKFSDHFALPLKSQKMLSENDPAAYLTGNMTQLNENEVIAYQLIATPMHPKLHREIEREIQHIKDKIRFGKQILPDLSENFTSRILEVSGISWLYFLAKLELYAALFAIKALGAVLSAFFDIKGTSVPTVSVTDELTPQVDLDPYEIELQGAVREKLNEHLFEVAIRLLVINEDNYHRNQRMTGLVDSFEQMSSNYQSLTQKGSFFPLLQTTSFRFNKFKQRFLSPGSPFNKNPILSSSEIADLYHFPYLDTNKTEGLHTNLSIDLPAPLIVKNTNTFDVTFGYNTYAGQNVPVGLTDDDRSRHTYLIGQTGSGKSTILFHSAKDDIQKGRGLCVIDPHGDLIEDLLTVIPKDRIQDVVYLDPYDIKYPIRINLLELSPDLTPDDLLLEKEIVTESVVSIFRRLFAKDESFDMHRIEHILRNAIYTAFYEKDATLFTVLALLTNTKYRNTLLKSVTDVNLLNFWKEEFSKAGNMQVFKMISGVTAKIERFQFSPTTCRILEDPHSSINFDTLLDQKKIILCNLSEGKLGEDTSRLIGTTIIAKIHLSILKRARTEASLREPFYLYVDEFQNFATSHFTKLLSGGRKYGLRITIAEQSTAQQQDSNITNILLANVGTVISFRTASPVDEELLLPQFSPIVKKGALLNLPRHHFYMKLGAHDPQDPFSAMTYPITITKNQQLVEEVKNASRQNYATVYKAPVNVLEKIFKKSEKFSINIKKLPKTRSAGSLG